MTETCLRRLSQLLNQYNQSQTYPVNLDDLENVFATSRRNTSNILKMLGEHGWITWTPGVGRGKISTLKITISIHQALYITIKEELKSGHFDQITKFLETYQGAAASALNEAMEDAARSQQQSNSLVISQYPWVNELHPALTYRFSELQITRSLYDTLLTIDANGEICPHLAYEYQVEDDFIYFWLRPDVHCHDGLILSHDDVLYSLQNIKETKGPVSWLFRQIKQVGYDDNRAAIFIQLEQPNPLFIYCLATANASIITRRSKEFSHNKSAPIGTGPFKLEFWDKDKLTIQKHHNYFAKCALLQEITLSHQGEELDKYISFNQQKRETESYMIQAFSYLALNRRPNSNLDTKTWRVLFDYLERKRSEFNTNDNLKPTCLVSQENTYLPNEPAPQLSGNLVIAHPKWTIHYLDQLTRWLIELIKETGLTVTEIDLSNASTPQLVKEDADLLIVEDIVEQPIEFGLYEWLLTGSAIRFAFNENELDCHTDKVHKTLSQGETKEQLHNLLKHLRADCTVLPLFWGKEAVTRTQQVSGVQIGKSGYSDFYKLWISQS